MSDVAENGTGEADACNAVLHQGVGADLHEAVFATLFHHPGQKRVELNGIGGRMSGREFLVVNHVDYCGEQTSVDAEFAHHVVQQSHRGGLAVGAGNAY